MARSEKTTYLVALSLMAAIICVMAFVPFLGYIPLGVIKATTLHIPVIIGAILLGPKAGGVLGGIFGLTSIIKNTMEPALVSFVFSPFVAVPGTDSGSWKALLISLVPRVLLGFLSGLFYQLLIKFDKQRVFSCAAAGIFGSLLNTVLVMSGIYILFYQEYAAAKQLAFQSFSAFILGTVFTNGIAEATVAAILCAMIARPLVRFVRKPV